MPYPPTTTTQAQYTEDIQKLMLSQYILLRHHIHILLLLYQIRHKILLLLNQIPYLIHPHFTIKFNSLILNYHILNHNHTFNHTLINFPHIYHKTLYNLHSQPFLIPAIPYDLMFKQLHLNPLLFQTISL